MKLLFNLSLKLFVIILLFVSSWGCAKKVKIVHDPKNCSDEISEGASQFQCHERDGKNFSFLAKYKTLKAIDLTGTSVQHINFLKELKDVEVLLLIDTKVKDLSALKHLAKLRELYLSKTDVSDISALKGLKNLRILHLDYTKMKPSSPIDLPQVEELDISHSQAVVENISLCGHVLFRDFLEEKNKNRVRKNQEQLEHYQIESYKDSSLQYMGISMRNLKNYPDFIPSLYQKLNNLTYLNLFGAAHGYQQFSYELIKRELSEDSEEKKTNTLGDSLTLENISSVALLEDLITLKLHLKSDKYLNVLLKLEYLKNLYLSGNIKKIDVINEHVENLYLYDTQVEDFSFLKESKVEYLMIVTKDIQSPRWKKLKDTYPKVEIEIKNLLFLPIKFYEVLDSMQGGYCVEVFDINLDLPLKEILKRDGAYLSTSCHGPYVRYLRDTLSDAFVLELE